MGSTTRRNTQETERGMELMGTPKRERGRRNAERLNISEKMGQAGPSITFDLGRGGHDRLYLAPTGDSGDGLTWHISNTIDGYFQATLAYVAKLLKVGFDRRDYLAALPCEEPINGWHIRRFKPSDAVGNQPYLPVPHAIPIALKAEHISGVNVWKNSWGNVEYCFELEYSEQSRTRLQIVDSYGALNHLKGTAKVVNRRKDLSRGVIGNGSTWA